STRTSYQFRAQGRQQREAVPRRYAKEPCVFFAAPAQRDPEGAWDQSNSAGAVRAALDACGLTWAIPHTFRRTVATLLDQANLPIARIADQLGHSDVSMS